MMSSTRTPFPEQEEHIYNISSMFATGKREIIGQLATGGGKTVEFSIISYRYLQRNPSKAVVIHVHRKELLKSTRKTLFEWFGIVAQPIISGMRHIPRAQVYIAMVETINNKLKADPAVIPNVGLCIIDECHRGEFHKIKKFYPAPILVLGFTATPISSKKKDPLKNHYEDIVCGIPISQLIKINQTHPKRGLLQNHTYSIKNGIDRKKLSKKGDDFNSDQMANVFSKSKQIKNTINGYKEKADGTKAVVFNCNIAHSKLVCQAFQEAGYDARHLDSDSVPEEFADKFKNLDDYRTDCFLWLKETPGAILCNVDIATTGFDEPSIETIIVNRATMSLALWIQMTGRGSRWYEYPDGSFMRFFTIIDLGGNAVTHGDWNDDRDWYNIFHNPPKPGKDGVAPVKDCPQCGAMIHARATTCPYCGCEMPPGEMMFDEQKAEFVLYTKNINIQEEIIKHPQYSPYFILKNAIISIVTKARSELQGMDKKTADYLLSLCFDKTKEWCKVNGKRYNEFNKKQAEDNFYDQLNKAFPEWQQQQAAQQ